MALDRVIINAKPGKYFARSTKATSGYFTKEGNSNLFYAIGGFELWGNGSVYVCNRGTYQAILDVSFYDRYNWDEAKETKFNLFHNLSLTIKDRWVGRLHKVGLAQEFDIVGS